jgi:hypothetical protein
MMLRTGTIMAVFMMASAVSIAGAAAQTLINPNPNPNSKTTPPPRPPIKAPAAGRSEACSGFGAGFVRVPGTDACLKIGGGVTTEATGIGN